MEWISITSAISLSVLAVCAIALVAIFWRRKDATIARVERVITWITFILTLIVIGLITQYKVPDTSDKIEFSLVVSVMGILVTALVGWQVWQAVVSREEIREIRNRMGRVESRANTLQNRIDQTNSNVKTFTEAARVLNLASCDISFSMVRELETNVSDISELDMLRCFIGSYMMSARAVAGILRQRRDEDIYMAMVGLAIGIMDRSSRRLFIEENRDFISVLFSTQEHNLCDIHFANITENVSSLEEDDFNRIMNCHSRRIAFRTQQTNA